MVDNFALKPLAWDSEFFNKNMAQLTFGDGCSTAAMLADFELVQAKVATHNYEQINTLHCLGFHLVEGEIDFSLQMNNVSSDLTVDQHLDIEQAAIEDIDQIYSIVGNSFHYSRFRLPWFSEIQRDAFYQLWAEKAVKGTFDDTCLIIRAGSKIKGFVTLKVETTTARIGLICVSSDFQRQGVGISLLSIAVEYCKAHNIQQLYVATQMANQSAIRLYGSFGFSINSLSFWFYKTHARV
jgi:dTDP-4-amino-4,6-dideoxy-D-galactose acyltransferase